MPQSEEQLRLLIENTRDYAILILDPDSRFVSQNSGARMLLGYEDDEIVGQPAAIIFTPEDQRGGAPDREVATALAEGRVEDRRWHVRKDGSRFFADGVLSPLWGDDQTLRGFGKVMRDATDRKRTLDALRERAELLDATHDTMFVRGMDDRITFWNRGAEETYGWSRDEAIGQTPHALLQTEFPLPPQDIQSELLRAGRWEGEMTHAKRDGTRIYVASRWVLRRDEAGAPHSILETDNDITERKLVEAELAAAYAQLSAAYERESRIAETLQRSMLLTAPQNHYPGLAVDTLYEAALNEAEVGGDFFDAFEFDEGRLALVVGDVSGKGLLAAAETAEVKYALRAFLHAYRSPQATLAALNDFLCDTHAGTEAVTAFITVTLATVDRGSGETTMTAAGSESPVVLRADGTTETFTTGGRPLGILAGAEYEAQTITLGSGDTVLMATDGITEARRGRSFLGLEGMADLAQSAGAASSLRRLGQTVLDGARAFAGGTLRDDACLLLARRL